MKALFLFVFVLASAAASAAQDPFLLALQNLPEQHQYSSPQTAPLSLAELEQLALQSNPEIRLGVRRVSTAQARIPGAGALEDPSVTYRGWQVPLRQPWNYNAGLNMFMIGQNFPGPGKRALRSEVVSDAVTVAKQELEAKKRDRPTSTCCGTPMSCAFMTSRSRLHGRRWRRRASSIRAARCRSRMC